MPSGLKFFFPKEILEYASPVITIQSYILFLVLFLCWAGVRIDHFVPQAMNKTTETSSKMIVILLLEEDSAKRVCFAT